MEWLKVLLEKAKLHSIIGAIAATVLLEKLFRFDLWLLILVFCVSFLLIEYFIYLVKSIKEGKKNAEAEARREEKQMQEYKKCSDLIWHFFLSMPDDVFILSKAIYYIEDKDPHNKYVRVVKDGTEYYYKLYRNENFNISVALNKYISCIHMKHLNRAIVVTFNPIFYDLLECYLETGRKEKCF